MFKVEAYGKSRVFYNNVEVPHEGWWLTSRDGATCWRWWDGSLWSIGAFDNDSADYADFVASVKSCRQAEIAWTWYWPEDGRIPRINPENGEVTGLLRRKRRWSPETWLIWTNLAQSVCITFLILALVEGRT